MTAKGRRPLMPTMIEKKVLRMVVSRLCGQLDVSSRDGFKAPAMPTQVSVLRLVVTTALSD
jgi:hypothetical protein